MSITGKSAIQLKCDLRYKTYIAKLKKERTIFTVYTKP